MHHYLLNTNAFPTGSLAEVEIPVDAQCKEIIEAPSRHSYVGSYVAHMMRQVRSQQPSVGQIIKLRPVFVRSLGFETDTAYEDILDYVEHSGTIQKCSPWDAPFLRKNYRDQPKDDPIRLFIMDMVAYQKKSKAIFGIHSIEAVPSIITVEMNAKKKISPHTVVYVRAA